MKSGRLLVFKPLFFFAAIFCLLSAATPNARASAEDQIDNALVVSKAWVAQIDAGQYDDSYSFGCGDMHDKIAQDKWDKILAALRAPWGSVVDRHQISHVYKPDGFEGAEGEFLVITYNTTFQKLPSATEVVVLKWEDGRWRGAGYNAVANRSADTADDYGPTSTTEVHTENNVQPPQQKPSN